MSDFIQDCNARIARSWATIKTGPFWREVVANGFERELYVTLMTEIYHYTRENAQNQALAAIDVHSDRLSLLRFCLHHAFEEAGHDLMALNDLRAVGVDPEAVVASRPLPETQAFIAYLYRVATTCDATSRLGYSLWAEGCYPHIAEVLDAMRTSLGLEDRDMTFFVAHSKIDAGHLEEVEQAIDEHCTTPELRAALIEVMETSLHLQGEMLAAVHRKWSSARVPAGSGA